MKLLGALGIDWKIFLIQAVNFLILFLILKWLFFRPFIEALRKEKKKIEEIKNGKEEIQRRKEEMQKREEEIIQKAKEKTKQIIEEGEEISEREKERIVDRTEREVRQILKEAQEKAKVEVGKIREREKERVLIKAKEALSKALSASFTKELHKKFLREVVSELKELNFEKISKKKIVQVIVISAFPLTKDEEKDISDFLFLKLKNPAFQKKLDPELIAGIKLLIDEFLIDGSLKSRIEKAI